MNISVTLTPKTSLEKALKKVGIEDPATITTLTIVGRVIESDIQNISENMRKTLQELDLSGASFEKNELPNWIFGGSLISVTIPNSITEINRYAFCCFNLTTITTNSENPVFASIDGVLYSKDKTELIKYPEGRQGDYVIPDSVKKINEAAFSRHQFSENIGLTSVTIPDSVEEIGYEAFFGCRGLTSITIPASVVEIGARAFLHCSGLTSIVIPDSITEIREMTFYCCSGLTSIIIPDSVTKIEDCAFNACSGLTTIVIPDSVTEIGGGAFLHCGNLTSVIIPYSVKKIDRSTFAYCGSLKSVVIPDSVTEIEFWAFRYCTALTSITIPKSVTKIEQEFWGVFFGCTATITVHPDNPVFSSENGVLFNKDKTELIAHPNMRQGDYHIPDSVTKIGNYAFSGCGDLNSIIIPDTVVKIGQHAFFDCYELTSVNIPESVTEIGKDAFNHCKNLVEIYIPQSVTKIGEDAFWYYRLNIMVHPENPVYKVVDGKIEMK